MKTEIDNFIFICPVHKDILDTDDKIEKHKHCTKNINNSCKYFNEEWIIENIDYFKHGKN